MQRRANARIDAYEGRTPHENRMLFGNDVPLFGQEFWRDFTDVDLGCG